MPVTFATLSGRLAWLRTCLSQKRNNIAALLGRLSGLGAPGSLNPALFRKFLDLLDDVAAAHEEEWNLIAQIEAVEQKHRFMRTHKKLKYVNPRAQPALSMRRVDEYQRVQKRSFFDTLLLLILWLIVLWNMFAPLSKINQKKQGVTGLKPIFTPFPLP